jgi:hypothetical protein
MQQRSPRASDVVQLPRRGCRVSTLRPYQRLRGHPWSRLPTETISGRPILLNPHPSTFLPTVVSRRRWRLPAAYQGVHEASGTRTWVTNAHDNLESRTCFVHTEYRRPPASLGGLPRVGRRRCCRGQGAPPCGRLVRDRGVTVERALTEQDAATFPDLVSVRLVLRQAAKRPDCGVVGAGSDAAQRAAQAGVSKG